MKTLHQCLKLNQAISKSAGIELITAADAYKKDGMDAHEAEKKAILQALEQTHMNKTKAAELLGIHRTLLYRKIKLLEIEL